MSTIENIPLTEKYAPYIRQDRPIPDYSLDFISSEDLEEIEDGIRETLRGVDTANLAIAITIAKIDQLALYAQSGCKSYLEYLDTAEDRLNMSRQTISDYKRIGETYLQYKSKLQEAGFQEEGNLHKLRYLRLALSNHRASDVFKRIVSLSFRKFLDYARGPSERSDIPDLEIKITSQKIMIDGINILNFDPELDIHVKEELGGYLKQIYKIRATGNVPHIINVYDDDEARAVERYLSRHRSK